MRKLLVLVVGLAVFWPTPAEAAPAPIDLTLRWSCTPSTIWVDPAAPADVLEAVAQWHRLYRRDWTFTTVEDDATVQIHLRKPVVVGAGGVAILYGTATTFVRAVVEIDPSPDVDQGNVARHELGHVAGLTHNNSSSWAHAMSPHPMLGRYSVTEMLLMATSARMCVR